MAGMKDDKLHPEPMTAKQRHGAASAEAALADLALAKFDSPRALQLFLESRAVDEAEGEDEGRRQFAAARAAAVQRKEEALLQYGESLIAWVNADDEEEEL